MNQLSIKMSFIRYCVVLVVMCVVTLGFRGFKPALAITFVIFALLCLKYLFFDYLVRMVRRRWPALKVLPWLWVGYALAAAVDIAATWVTMNDEGGASLALWIAVFVTPGFLAAALALMTVHTLIARKRSSSRASRFPNRKTDLRKRS